MDSKQTFERRREGLYDHRRHRLPDQEQCRCGRKLFSKTRCYECEEGTHQVLNDYPEPWSSDDAREWETRGQEGQVRILKTGG